MKKRLTEGPIAYAVAQESTGQTIAENCRKIGGLHACEGLVTALGALAGRDAGLAA
jgi:hypothetical protein